MARLWTLLAGRMRGTRWSWQGTCEARAAVSNGPLTILNVAYPLAPVGPDAVGGAEQILTCLDEALVRAGHTSVVVAAEGSTTRGVLLPVATVKGHLDERTQAAAHAATRHAIERVLHIRGTLTGSACNQGAGGATVTRNTAGPCSTRSDGDQGQ